MLVNVFCWFMIHWLVFYSCVFSLPLLTFFVFAWSYWLDNIMCQSPFHPSLSSLLTFLSFSPPLTDPWNRLADKFRPSSVAALPLPIYVWFRDPFQANWGKKKNNTVSEKKYVSILISNMSRIFFRSFFSHRKCMDHRYRKYLKNGKEPLRGIMLEILKKYIYYKKKTLFGLTAQRSG